MGLMGCIWFFMAFVGVCVSGCCVWQRGGEEGWEPFVDHAGRLTGRDVRGIPEK